MRAVIRSVSFYFETLQTGETERDIIRQQVTTKVCARSGMSTISSSRRVTGVPVRVSRTPLSVYFICTPSREKNSCTAAVTLITVWEQPGQLYRFLFITLQRFFILLILRFSFQRQYLVPVRCGAPITLYGKRNILVAARMDSNGVFGAPLGTSSKVVYQLEGEVDIGVK